MILKTLEILQKVKNNELTIEQAQKMIEQPLDYATIDYNRKKRTGNKMNYFLFLERFLADSNRRIRFCRPAPSHSAKEPYY